MDRDGLITIQSQYTPKDTMQRLEAGVKTKGMTIFAHIDHAAGAAEVGMALPTTDLLILGSPKGGTPLMQSAQTIGIDLPLKALVWEDAKGHVWLSMKQASNMATAAGAFIGASTCWADTLPTHRIPAGISAFSNRVGRQGIVSPKESKSVLFRDG
jgi:uncharacterized protein (DUF302 family)